MYDMSAPQPNCKYNENPIMTQSLFHGIPIKCEILSKRQIQSQYSSNRHFKTSYKSVQLLHSSRKAHKFWIVRDTVRSDSFSLESSLHIHLPCLIEVDFLPSHNCQNFPFALLIESRTAVSLNIGSHVKVSRVQAGFDISLECRRQSCV